MCLDFASLKRCAFSDPLKFTLLLSPLTLSGRLFQSLMAFIKKDPSSLPLMVGCIKASVTIITDFSPEFNPPFR